VSTVIICEIRTRSGWLPGGAVTVTWKPGTHGQPDSYDLEVSDGERTRAAVRLDPEQATELALELAPGLAKQLREHERQKANRIEHGKD
jgi:hypothetical protein